MYCKVDRRFIGFSFIHFPGVFLFIVIVCNIRITHQVKKNNVSQTSVYGDCNSQNNLIDTAGRGNVFHSYLYEICLTVNKSRRELKNSG